MCYLWCLPLVPPRRQKPFLGLQPDPSLPLGSWRDFLECDFRWTSHRSDTGRSLWGWTELRTYLDKEDWKSSGMGKPGFKLNCGGLSGITLIDLCDAALLQSPRRTVDFSINYSFSAVQADGERCRLVHLQTRLLLDDNILTHSEAASAAETPHPLLWTTRKLPPHLTWRPLTGLKRRAGFVKDRKETEEKQQKFGLYVFAVRFTERKSSPCSTSLTL